MGDISRCYILFIVIMLVCFYKCHMEKLDGVEGSSCVVEGYNGTCLNINKCYQMIKAIAGNIEPKVCSYEGNVPIVCCTECEGYHVKNISNAVFAGTLGILWKNGEKAWDKCLDYISSNRYPCPYDTFIRQRWDDGRKCHTFYEVWAQFLSGGDNVFKGELPHMALLGYGRLLETAQWLCGGSLISETFILTAGHCISSAKLGPVQYAALGILKRSDPPEIWQRYSIKRRIPHPDYKSPRKYHDIALLETASPVKFSWLVLPICLPVGLGDKIHAVAAGWGAVGYMQPLSDGLKQVTVDKFSDEECSDIYQPHRNFLHGYNSTTQMCFGHHILSKDTCEGDSGGPLFYKKGCHFHVIGVTSYGVACGFRGNAGMYTRVDHYVPWIESIVWPSS